MHSRILFFQVIELKSSALKIQNIKLNWEEDEMEGNFKK